MSQTSEPECKINIVPLSLLQGSPQSESPVVVPAVTSGLRKKRKNSQNLKLNVVRNLKSNNSSPKIPKLQPRASSSTTNPSRTNKPRKSKFRLSSQTGEKQGQDIRKFFSVINENKPSSISIPVKTDDNLRDSMNPGLAPSNSTHIHPEPKDLKSLKSEHVLLLKSERSPTKERKEIEIFTDSRNSENGSGSSPEVNTSILSQIVISDVRSLNQFEPDQIKKIEEQKGGFDFTINQEQKPKTDSLKSNNELLKESKTISHHLKPGCLAKKNSLTQIDEISSSGVKLTERKRVNSSCSNSSQHSTSKISMRSLAVEMEIQAAFEKNNWSRVFHLLLKNAARHQDKILPTPDQISTIISYSVLKSCKRNSRDSRLLASDFFENFVKLGLEVSDLMLDSLELVELRNFETTDHQNCYWIVISQLFDDMKEEAVEKRKSLILNFLEQLFYIVSNNYKAYLKQTVKLKFPVIARIFQGPDCNNETNLINNFKCLLGHLTCIQNFKDEFKMGLKWMNLITSHVLKFNISNDLVSSLVSAFMVVVSDTEEPDYGLFVLKNLEKQNAFVQEVILESVRRELKEIIHLSPGAQLKFMEEISRSWRVRVYEYDFLEKVCQTQPQNTDPWEFSKPPLGESKLHKYCGILKTKSHYLDLLRRVRLMKKEKIGNINVLDNGLNTPLHEAVYHGRSNVLALLCKEFYIPNGKPGPHCLHLLAKNNKGDTPLHLAAKRNFEECKILIEMCSEEKEKLHILLQTTNEQGKTPIDVANSSTRDFLTSYLPELDEEDFIFAGIKLAPVSINTLKKNNDLLRLIAYWRNLSKEV